MGELLELGHHHLLRLLFVLCVFAIIEACTGALQDDVVVGGFWLNFVDITLKCVGFCLFILNLPY